MENSYMEKILQKVLQFSHIEDETSALNYRDFYDSICKITTEWEMSVVDNNWKELCTTYLGYDCEEDIEDHIYPTNSSGLIALKPDSRYLWSLIETEGVKYVVPGKCTVNCLGYIMGKYPWSDNTLKYRI